MRTILMISYCLLAYSLSAQVKFNSGDADLDKDLETINTNAKSDLPAFHAELSASFGVTSKNIEYMTSIKMEPAEIYFALEIAAAIGKPVEEVVSTYEKNRDKGWGYVAQQMGIKPGSAEFHALKGKSKTKKEKVSKGNGNGSTPSSAPGNTGRKKK